MYDYALIDNNGRVLQSGQVPSEGLIDAQAANHPNLTLVRCSASAGRNYIKDGAVKEYPPIPQMGFDFDYVTEQWFDARTIEQLMGELRKERDHKLSASDWTQVPDAPVDQAAWAAYRQALRDLPANTTDPANPVWPTPPA